MHSARHATGLVRILSWAELGAQQVPGTISDEQRACDSIHLIPMFVAQSTPVNNLFIHGTPELHCYFTAHTIQVKYVYLVDLLFVWVKRLGAVYCRHSAPHFEKP